MLKNILSGSTCAKCRICCIFDNYDLWVTPVVSDELYEKLLKEYPGTEFLPKGKSRIFKCVPDVINGEELFICPMLDHKTGCKLGDDKPFDCRIWPYRVMELGGKLVISMASICPTMYEKPLKKLVEELHRDGLADKIFSHADTHPDIVKPYDNGYPILVVEK